MSRTNNALKAMSSNLILQLTIAICGFILPPLIIAEYGSEINGLVSTIRQMITYFSIVTLGLTTAGSVALYQPLEEKNFKKINAVLSAIRSFYYRTGVIFSFLISLGAFILPIIRQTNGISAGSITSIFLICGLGNIIEYIITAKYRVLLTADQKIFVLAKIQTEGTILNTLCSVLLIKVHASIISVQLVATIIYLLRMIMTVRYIKKFYPYLNLKVKPDYAAINNRWDALMYQASGMIITYSPLILVSMLLSFSDASIFTVYNLIYSSIAMIVGIFSSGLAAVFGNVLIRKEEKVLENSFSIFEFLYRVILYVAYTCALLLIIPFISIYVKSTDGTDYIVPQLAVFITLNGLFKNIRVPYTTLVEAGGRFKENNRLNIIEAIFNVVLTILCIKWIGLPGVMLGGAVCGLVRSIIYMRYIGHTFFRGKWIKFLIYNFINFIVMLLMYYSITDIYVENYFQWFMQAIKYGIITLVLISVLNICLDIKVFKSTLGYIKDRISNKLSFRLVKR